MKEVTTGNCTPLVEMSILTVSSVTQKKSIPLSKQLVQQLNRENSRLIAEEEPINFEIDQYCESGVSSNVQEHHTFYRNVVAYMAGYVVRKIRKVLNCEVCVSALTEDDSLISSSDWLHYTRFKDMGGLLYPSKDVVKICIQCEKKFKANVHSNLSKINVLQLVNLTALSFVGENMFPALRGSSRRKWSKLSNFCFLLKKSLQVWGIASQIFRGLVALEPPQNGGQNGGQRGSGSFFSVFNRKRKRQWKKYFVHFVGNLSRIPKLFFFSF